VSTFESVKYTDSRFIILKLWKGLSLKFYFLQESINFTSLMHCLQKNQSGKVKTSFSGSIYLMVWIFSIFSKDIYQQLMREVKYVSHSYYSSDTFYQF